MCLIVLAPRCAGPASASAGADGGVDVRRPPRPDPAAGRGPGPARRLARRVRAPLGRRYAVRRRLRRRDPARPAARLEVAVVDVSGKGEEAGTRALLLSGAFGGLLGRAAGRPVPPGRQRLPAAPGLGGGLRDGDPPLPRPGQRRLRGAHGRPPAGRAPPGRHRALGGAADRGADPRPDAGRRRSPRRSGRLGARRRAAALHRRHGRGAAARHRPRASTGCWGRPSTCCAAASTGAARRLVDALGIARRRPRRWSSFRGAEGPDR